MDGSKVLIIIVTYENKKYVTNLLKSLSDIDYKNYDIVVVDNASTDGTADYIEEYFPGIKVIRNTENNGGSGGFNTGLSYAFQKTIYKYYWLLDNDVVVSKDALEKLVRVLDENSKVAVAGSQMCQLDNPEVTNEIGAFVNLHSGGLVLNRHLTRRRNNSSGIFNVDYVAAASMLVRAEVANKAGLWEDFFIHFDDVDWCLRIKEMGYRVVGVADSVIWHVSGEEKPVTWTLYYDIRNVLYLLDKHASKKDVKRFLRRQCLRAFKAELKGLTPIAEIMLDAVKDFNCGKKGKKIFNLPDGIDDDALKKTHPNQDVFLYQNEWLDLKRFPLDDENIGSIKEILLPDSLMDADFYWKNNSNITVKRYRKYIIFVSIITGLFGYRKYRRSYVDIRETSCIPAFWSDELVVKINETNWLIKRDTLSARRSFFKISKRAIKYFLFNSK